MIKKRFIIDDDGIVTDMVDLSMYIDNEDCCEKLNELNDENKKIEYEIDKKITLLTDAEIKCIQNEDEELYGKVKFSIQVLRELKDVIVND